MRQSPRPVPGWVNVADFLTLALAVLAAIVFLTGGWRWVVAGERVSLTSGWRILLWAALLAGARQAAWRGTSLPLRIAAGSARAVRRPARAVRRALTLVRDFARLPVREARSLGPGLGGCLATARECWPVLTAATLLVLVRSFVFVWYEQAAFNSDHAIVGLMAKHLAEGRAFPLFFYGQSYMLGVEAWLAAPVFLLAGPSVLNLQLPLLALNVLVAWLLILLLRREAGLSQTAALAATIVFALAPPATALALVEANGGSVEPFLYILLLWVLRHRPALFGITLGFGFLHREFTVYGAVALVALRLASRRAVSRETVRHLAVAAGWFVVIWGGVQLLKPLSSPFGPGTSGAWGSLTSTNVGEMLTRVCWAPADIRPRLLALWNRHFDVLFGTGPHSLGFLGVRSRTAGQGFPGLGLAMRIVLAAMVARVALNSVRAASLREVGFAAYLFLTGACSVAVYWIVACETIGSQSIRYNLLALLLVVGLSAAFFRLERGRSWRGGALAAAALWTAVSAFSHGRLLDEYVLHTPPNEARQAADALVAAGVRHATAGYWTAYRLTFLANERVWIASDAPIRIVQYQDTKGAATYVLDRPCEGGTPLAGRFHRCPAR